MRQSKSVPKGLVVEETGTSKGDVVDWSTGQQLVEVTYAYLSMSLVLCMCKYCCSVGGG